MRLSASYTSRGGARGYLLGGVRAILLNAVLEVGNPRRLIGHSHGHQAEEENLSTDVYNLHVLLRTGMHLLTHDAVA